MDGRDYFPFPPSSLPPFPRSIKTNPPRRSAAGPPALRRSSPPPSRRLLKPGNGGSTPCFSLLDRIVSSHSAVRRDLWLLSLCDGFSGEAEEDEEAPLALSAPEVDLLRPLPAPRGAEEERGQHVLPRLRKVHVPALLVVSLPGPGESPRRPQVPPDPTLRLPGRRPRQRPAEVCGLLQGSGTAPSSIRSRSCKKSLGAL